MTPLRSNGQLAGCMFPLLTRVPIFDLVNFDRLKDTIMRTIYDCYDDDSCEKRIIYGEKKKEEKK